MVITSLTNGTFLNVIGFSNKMDDAIKDKQEFFAPSILTVPLTPLLGPLIAYLFI
jgi:hypothetical protein